MHPQRYYNECPQCKQLIGPTQHVTLVGKTVYHVACVVEYASRLAYENQVRYAEGVHNAT